MREVVVPSVYNLSYRNVLIYYHMTKIHLQHKRDELIYALSVQDYNSTEIAEIFNLSRGRIHGIIQTRPKNYQSPWVKIK